VEDDIRGDRLDGQDRQDDIALLELASMIDEDQTIDWDSEEGVVRGDEERAVLAELRVLAALTRVYRDPDAVGLETEGQELAEPPLPPATWGSLAVFEQVGRGGFAKVYRARDALGRDVAVKLFPVTPENAGALSSRVLREGSLLAKISHRNVVVVHGVERSNDFVGLWMEFIHGRTMEDELRARGPLSAEEATPIGVDLCQALAAVHGRGLVHRDVKAQNIMREQGGRTVLMDFGAGTELTTGLRQPIDTAGTPLYLAPELFDGSPATRASDIYSLGVLLYRMVTREYPVDGADRSQIERAHREGRVKRLRDVRPDLPSGFIQTVECALSPDPAARPQTAGELEAALTSKTAPTVPLRTWWQRAAAVAAAIVLVAVPVAWFVANQTKGPDSTNPSSAISVERPPATPATAVDPTYTVKAALYRTRDDVEVPLTSATGLIGGDQLSMRIEASTDVYVYVLNADDAAKSYRLFPLPNRQPDNPLRASKVHRLPAEDTNWAVTAEGGREHFVIVVTPVRSEAFEAVVRTIPPARAGGGSVTRAAIPSDRIGVLRSVGGLVKAKTIAKASEPSLNWYDTAGELTGLRETTSGPWMRKLTVPGAGR
jgi:serine/threonine-protein kinase